MPMGATEKLHHTSVAIPKSDYRKFQKIAQRGHRTVSQEIRRLIAERIAEHEKAAEAA
jgi:hypothetical protein